MTKFFVDPVGVYLGGFEGADPPPGSVEVAGPPEHGWQTWDGAAWNDTPELTALRQRQAEAVSLPELIDALKAKGVLAAADLDAVRGNKA